MNGLPVERKVRTILPIVLLSAFILLTFSACSATATQPTTSGIHGTVLIGPISPVSKVGEVNERPYPNATIFVMDPSGRYRVAEVVSDKDGFFKVNLAPGKYLLDPQSPNGQSLPVAQPQSVLVSANGFVEVTIHYDSGIR